MHISGPIAIAIVVLAHSAHAAEPVQPPRWIMADDVRVHSDSVPGARANGALVRGAEVILKAPDQGKDMCLIEGEGQYGFVACKYLSAKPVPRARAGENGIPADQRWVTGTGLTLRAAPAVDAAVTARLSLNSIVKLVREVPGGGYCEVLAAGASSGFTACRYLAPTPVVLAHVLGSRPPEQAPSPDFNLERGFWMAPGWTALERYADYLKTRAPQVPANGPWPRDEALERMKAHLALGIYGPRPVPFADWATLKRKAAQFIELDQDAQRLRKQGKKAEQELFRVETLMSRLSGDLEMGIGITGPLHDRISGDGGAMRTAQLVNALAFPTAAPSLFRSEAELAPPGSSAEEVSGRFGIVFRQLVSRRPVPASPDGGTGGLYDMLARTQVLVRPVQRVHLFTDGRLSQEPSLLRASGTLWRDVDEPMCEGWSPGFAFGASDPGVWRYFNNDAAAYEKENRNPPGSLFAFYTPAAMPAGPARRVETPVRLNRDATGFVQGTHWHFDIDGDGNADLSVWEGLGKGPGHLDGVTQTDDRWYRLAMVNINGTWKVLGHDTFGYGCGC